MAPDSPDPCPAGAGEAFDRFTRRLVGLARRQLGGLLRHKVDPEDVVQSVYKSFLLRYGAEMLAGEDEGGLWALLTRITLRKCADRARYHRAECRDAAREAAAPADGAAAWQDVAGREPTPDEAAALAETVERLLRGLGADERAILELSLQGYSTPEISERLGRAERSVRRVRERARALLGRMRDETAP
jgi:RNA polymerase sigma-70 factor, ECF subfamily